MPKGATTVKKNRIEPKIALTIFVHGYKNIPFVVTDSAGVIKHMTDVSHIGTNYAIRRSVIAKIIELVELYEVDTLILTQNKLFVDKVDRYPDPLVLRDIMLGYGIQVSVEDNFYTQLDILAIPDYEWKNLILGKGARYSIDLFKSHVLHRTDIPKKQMVLIDTNNYYEAVCLSESVLFDNLMQRKYQINKGD